MSVANPVARSVAKSVARSVAVGESGDGQQVDTLLLESGEPLLLEDGTPFLIDSVPTLIQKSIRLVVEDGSSGALSLESADIDYIGYWQIFGGVRGTTGSIEFTPVDLTNDAAPWQSGGILDGPAGSLRIDLPIHAMTGEPDAIEIEIVPASGTVELPNPIVNV